MSWWRNTNRYSCIMSICDKCYEKIKQSKGRGTEMGRRAILDMAVRQDLYWEMPFVRMAL